MARLGERLQLEFYCNIRDDPEYWRVERVKNICEWTGDIKTVLIYNFPVSKDSAHIYYRLSPVLV